MAQLTYEEELTLISKVGSKTLPTWSLLTSTQKPQVNKNPYLIIKQCKGAHSHGFRAEYEWPAYNGTWEAIMWRLLFSLLCFRDIHILQDTVCLSS